MQQATNPLWETLSADFINQTQTIAVWNLQTFIRTIWNFVRARQRFCTQYAKINKPEKRRRGHYVTESCSGTRLWCQLCSSRKMRLGDAWNFFSLIFFFFYRHSLTLFSSGSVWSQYYQPCQSFGGQNLINLFSGFCSSELFLHQKSYDVDMLGCSVFLHGYPIYFQISCNQSSYASLW